MSTFYIHYFSCHFLITILFLILLFKKTTNKLIPFNHHICHIKAICAIILRRAINIFMIYQIWLIILFIIICIQHFYLILMYFMCIKFKNISLFTTKFFSTWYTTNCDISQLRDLPIEKSMFNWYTWAETIFDGIVECLVIAARWPSTFTIVVSSTCQSIIRTL